MKNYFLKLSILSALILLIGAVLFCTVLSQYFVIVMPFVLVFFITLSSILHKVLVNANKLKTARFVPVFMLATFIKLMLCLIFMASYAMADKENAVPFILFFLSLYMIFTSFEVYSILPEVRKARA
ncbi:MAG: hypothetical protein JXR58_01440 [Bacteroidales bacterium]|nr:hypothetical protein [Bacteroidales bacterium]